MLHEICIWEHKKPTVNHSLNMVTIAINACFSTFHP